MPLVTQIILWELNENFFFGTYWMLNTWWLFHIKMRNEPSIEKLYSVLNENKESASWLLGKKLNFDIY